jgi:hypothetical protein
MKTKEARSRSYAARRTRRFHLDFMFHEALVASSDMTVRELTDFQIRCEQGLSNALQQVGRSIAGRMLDGQTETFITGNVSGLDLQFWIYEDGADFKSSRDSRHFERPDFDSLDELAVAFTASIVEAAQ